MWKLQFVSSKLRLQETELQNLQRASISHFDINRVCTNEKFTGKYMVRPCKRVWFEARIVACLLFEVIKAPVQTELDLYRQICCLGMPAILVINKLWLRIKKYWWNKSLSNSKPPWFWGCQNLSASDGNGMNESLEEPVLWQARETFLWRR